MQRGKEQLIVNLKEVISEEIKSTPVILEEKKQKSIIPNFSLNQKLRAKEIIVDFFRTAKITKHFYQKDGYQTYINMLLPNDEKDKIDGELNELMKIMFGRTIAAIKDEPDFPFVNPNVHKDAFYHRDDDLTSPFLNKILADFEDKRNTQRFIYIPYTILKTLPIHEVIKIYLEEYTKNINVLTDNKSNIGFLKIDKKNKSASELCNIHSIIRSTGMIASPWQLAQYYVQHNSLKQNNHTNTSHSMFRLHLPNNFKEFLTNKKIIELKLLAQSNHPTHYLAQSLFNLFSQLRQINIDKNSLKRMYTFLSIGLNFYKKNYPRFAMITYGIIHEMTAILCKMQPLHNVINYSKFKQAAEENAISYFHIENKSFGEDCKYRSIALPANSGMNAHVIAIKLAKQMTVDGKKVNDEVYRTGPFYYEFDNINDSITDDKSAYIYLVSSGSIMSAKLDTTIPGVDINKIIKKRILLDEKKPVTLVIDCTSGLYKYLKLEPEIQRWVIRGMLSIIVYESHQKFGLLHTDQAQYGRVFGLCSKEHFSEDFIKELERNAAIDIENIPDMAIGAFIDIACGDVLEKIKEQHFLNGDVFRKAFEKWGFLPEVHTYEDMLDNKKDLFFINYFTRSALGRAITKGIKLRDSFAHFTTTCSGIGTLVRLSANASDKIDILIIACQLYIASQKLPINILHSLFTEYLLLFQSQGHSLFEDEIIFFSVANILGKNFLPNNNPLYENISIMLLLHDFLLSSNNLLFGRKCYHDLFSHLQSHLNIYIENNISMQNIIQHLKYLRVHKIKEKLFREILKEYIFLLNELDSPYKISKKAKLILHLTKLDHLLLYKMDKLNVNQEIKSSVTKNIPLSTHPLASEAIIILHNENLLNEKIVEKVIKNDGTVYLTSFAIIKLFENNLLNKNTISVLEQDNYISQAFFKLIFANVYNKKVFSILSNEMKEFKNTELLALAILKISSCKLINETVVSKLIRSEDNSTELKNLSFSEQDKIRYFVLSLLTPEERQLEMSKWPINYIATFYHYLKQESKEYKKYPLIQSILQNSNILFTQRFYSVYHAKYKPNFFSMPDPIEKLLNNKKVVGIDEIESYAQKSYKVKQILSSCA